MKTKIVIFALLLIGGFFLTSSISQAVSGTDIKTEQSTSNKVLEFAQTPFAKTYINLLDTDLSMSFTDNGVVVTSKDDFNYIKLDGRKAPKNASAIVDLFDLKVKIVKKGGTITVQKL